MGTYYKSTLIKISKTAKVDYAKQKFIGSGTKSDPKVMQWSFFFNMLLHSAIK